MESLENCHVCHIPPSDNKVHYKHYGGLCCFNCKAFFKYSRDRNLAEANGRSKYKCINNKGGPCEVHYQAKKKCKKCRYAKCVQIGMDGELIRQGSERQKYTRQKLTGFKRKPSDSHQIIQDIAQAYDSSLKKTIRDNDLTRFLQAGHQPGVHWTKRHSDALIEVMNLHSKMVVDMVSNLDMFKTLCPEDQKVLIDNNAKLYKYYIMARYFTHHNSKSQKVTQLSWLLRSEFGSGCDIPEKSLLEVNRWAQLIPQKRHKMLARIEIFKRCLNTIKMEYQYPQSLSGLIGFYFILATNHWADCAKLTLKQPERLENLQRQAEELFLIGWNEQSDQVSTGQLVVLVDNLNLMSLVSRVPDVDHHQNENMSKISTEFCTELENQWVDYSINKYQKTCHKNQMTEQMIHCCLNSGKGNYDLYQQVKVQFYQMQVKRCHDLMADLGLTLDLAAAQVFMMFSYIKVASFYSVKDHIEWGMGNIKLEFTSDDYIQSHSRALSIYDVLKLDGAFVGKEKQALQFKEIQEELCAFIEIPDVSHLFMMSLLFDSDDKRHLQHQYQRVLTKKLAENCQTLGAQNGEDAMATLISLFKEYLTFTVKFQEF